MLMFIGETGVYLNKMLEQCFFYFAFNILYKLLLKLEYFVIETMIKTKITIQS